ncbi:hypothetical protein [uncultured Ruegeria sp.]|uniref:hypothetical protein n=1 Tax=uncultured Ruegeria sp. TaxID=259304 RepID=UPI00260C2B82|nr:hypothetical protein [uncultured Ruegeria sp.]
MGGAYKANKRGGPRHVQLMEWLQASQAWTTLKPGPRALYVELKRRFNGGNNGEIFLSHRAAAKALNVDRKTVAGYFDALIERGFIVVTRGHCLGPSGIGQSATYRLTEEKTVEVSATKEFMRWKPGLKKKNPRVKTTHSLGEKLPTGGVKTTHLEIQRRKNSPAFGPNEASAVGKNSPIYTSSHIPLNEVDAFERLALGLGLCGKATQSKAITTPKLQHVVNINQPNEERA